MEERRERIKVWMGACIIAVAFFLDLFEMVTTWLGIGIVMSIIIAPCATLMFWIWYKILGVPFLASPKKFATLAITSFVEIIPAFDAIPILSWGWTIGAIILVVMVRAEDSGGILGTLAGTGMGMMQARYKNFKSAYDDPEKAKELRKYLSFKKEDVVEAAHKRNPQFSKEQYGRGIGMAGDIATKKISDPQTRRQFLGLGGSDFRQTEKNKNVPEQDNILDLSESGDTITNSYRAPLESGPAIPPTVNSDIESSGKLVSVEPAISGPEIIGSKLEGIIPDQESQVVPPLESDLDIYLENNVYKNFGVSHKDEEVALSLETSEVGREQLKRSFENSRNSLSTLYKMETVDGRVDERALSAEQKKRQAEVLYPVLEKSFGDITERMRQSGVELSLKDIDISQDNFDFNSYDRKLRDFGDKFEESVQTKIGERIAQTLSSGQSYKGLNPLTAEEQSDRATRRKWERAFGQIVSEEYDEFLGKSQFNYDDFRRQVNDEISKTNSSLPIISREKYRVKTDREQLTNEILEEHQRTKNTGFLNSNISASSLKKVLEGGQFKDVFSMTPEELSKVAGGTRAFESYLEKRDAIERGLGARQKGDETIVYGTFASDFNDENILGGASQYGDIFIKFKKGTRATYTESDSMAPRDSELVASKPREVDNSVEGRLSDAANDAKSRQVASEHAAIAKALLSHDLKRMAKMRGESNSNFGRHYAYLEAQIIDPTFDDIESINIPKAALAKANDEEAGFLQSLADNPKWQGKINFI